MKSLHLSLLIYLVSLIALPLMGQTGDKYITLGDTVINYNVVDLQEGFKFYLSNETIKDKYGNNIYAEISKTVFVNKKTFEYIVIIDSAFFQGYAGCYNTFIEYYDSSGKIRLNRGIPELTVENCFLTKEKVFLKLGNGEDRVFMLLDSAGNIENNIEDIEIEINSSYLNKIVATKIENQQNNEFQVDFYVDNNNECKSLTFIDHEPFISFSSNENIITIRYNGTYYLYNNELELIRELSFWDYHIYVFNHGKSYFIKDRNKDNYCEIRDFDSDKLLFLVDSVQYNGGKKPIYFSGVVNRGSDIFVNGFFSNVLVFNFYDIEGSFINSDTTSNFKGMNGVSFKKEKNGYKILTNYEY